MVDLTNLSTAERTERRIQLLEARHQHFTKLDEIVTILGTTKQTFWPFFSQYGTDLFPYGAGSSGAFLFPSDGSIRAIEAEFRPMPIGNGSLYALYLDSSTTNFLEGVTNAAYNFGTGTVDSPFSLGLWVYLTEALGAIGGLISHLDSSDEEWEFRYDASGNLILELHDADANASEIATGTGDVLVPFEWNFCVATYDGGEADPVVKLFRNGVDSNAAQSPLTVETNAYVAMQNEGKDIIIGGTDNPAAPNNFADCYVTLPFITGKELSLAEVNEIYNIGKELIGLEQ